MPFRLIGGRNMTKEELKQEAEEYAKKNGDCFSEAYGIRHRTYIDSAEPREKRIAELEEKISVLLSCKKCPENKGGFICQKEYEDKCLTQKIQYIKELQEENKVLAQNLEDTEVLNKAYEKRFSDLEKEVTELKGEADSVLDNWCKGDDPCPHLKKRDEHLTKAKEHIENLLYYVKQCTCERSNYAEIKEDIKQAEQFLKGE